jgi:hypothetical protein
MRLFVAMSEHVAELGKNTFLADTRNIRTQPTSGGCCKDNSEGLQTLQFCHWAAEKCPEVSKDPKALAAHLQFIFCSFAAFAV